MNDNTKKGIISILFVLITSLFLAACSKPCTHEFDSGTVIQNATCTEPGVITFRCTLCGEGKNESIACIPHDYKKTITKEATYDNTGEITFTCTVCGNSYTEVTPVKERTVDVTVIDKRNEPKDTSNGRYSDQINFVFNIDNQYEKDIKGIEGILHIQDLFGKDILSVNCNFTGRIIPAGSSITVDTLNMEVNQFIDSQTKVYNQQFSDLLFNYEILSIVFAEDSNSSSKQEQAVIEDKNIPVSVNVVDKKNIPEDIHSYRFSDRVEFIIEVTNNSNKEIKGVSGVLTIKDLFGKDIMSSGCDFTGQTISPGATAVYSNLGMDINQFIDKDVKLYTQKYDDLIFEYTTKSIIYNDGTNESFD